MVRKAVLCWLNRRVTSVVAVDLIHLIPECIFLKEFLCLMFYSEFNVYSFDLM